MRSPSLTVLSVTAAVLTWSPAIAPAAPTTRWKLALSPGAKLSLRVAPQTGRVLIVDGLRARLLDRAGAVLRTETMPRSFGEHIDVVELGARGLVLAGGRGALLVPESGATRAVAIPDGRSVGAAPLPDGGVLVCFASDGTGGIAALDAEGRRRWTAKLDIEVTRCGPAGLQADGTLWASGKHTVVAVGPDGRVKARIEVAGEIERAPAAWPAGALVQTDRGLIGVTTAGLAFTAADIDDGPAVEGALAIGQAGRRLVWIDPSGVVRRTSSPLESPLPVPEGSHPLEEQAPQKLATLLGVAAGDALVLLGPDGKERFRVALPGALLAVLLGDSTIVVARNGELEAVALVPAVLADPAIALQEVLADPGLDAWAKVAAFARAPADTPAPVAELARLQAQLLALYPKHGAEVLQTLDELGPITTGIALALLELPLRGGDGLILAPLLARGGATARAPLLERLIGLSPSLVAAHALALLSGTAPANAADASALVQALTAPGSGGCPGDPGESGAWKAVIEVLGGLDASALEVLTRALAGPALPACRARAVRAVWERNSPPDKVVARFREEIERGAPIEAADLRRMERLGAPAAAMLVALLDGRRLEPEASLSVVESLGRMRAQAQARAALLSIVAGTREVPDTGREAAARALADDAGAEVCAAILSALQQKPELKGPLLDALLSAAARRESPGDRKAVEAALESLLARRTDDHAVYAVLRTLAEVAPDHAGGRALAIALDGARPESARLKALRVVARCPRSAMRPSLEQLADGGGAVGGLAARMLLPYLGLRLDERQRIVDVHAASSASRAGVRAGDMLVSMDGQRFANLTAYEEYLSTLRLGAPIALELLREGRSTKVQLYLGSALDLEAGD